MQDAPKFGWFIDPSNWKCCFDTPKQHLGWLAIPDICAMVKWQGMNGLWSSSIYCESLVYIYIYIYYVLYIDIISYYIYYNISLLMDWWSSPNMENTWKHSMLRPWPIWPNIYWFPGAFWSPQELGKLTKRWDKVEHQVTMQPMSAKSQEPHKIICHLPGQRWLKWLWGGVGHEFVYGFGESVSISGNPW